MALRITVSHEDSTPEVRLEGSLDARGVVDLREACCSLKVPMRLDLSGLQSADKVGIDTLRSLRTGGAELNWASPYISELLRLREERR